VNAVNWAELYVHFHAHIVIRMVFGADNAEYHLIVFPIPPRWHREPNGQAVVDEAPVEDFSICDSDQIENAVFGPVCEFIQCPDGWVPSLVRLEQLKERKNLIREIFASPPLDDGGKEFVFRVSNGEVRVLEPGVASKLRGGEPALVERGTKSFDNLDG
jgi:hypothetical protein